MDKYAINHSTLVSIGDAIREKEGSTEEIVVSDLADRIKALRTGGYELPSEALVLTGNCDYMFQKNIWNWYIDTLGEDVVVSDITSAKYMFNECDELECIPFDLVFNPEEGNPTTGYLQHDSEQMFYRCYALKEFKGKIVNFTPSTFYNMFAYSWNLRYLPEFENFSSDCARNHGSRTDHMFGSCFSLREIPESFLKQIRTLGNASSSSGTIYSHYNGMFSYCASLDEIKGLYPENSVILRSYNCFNTTFIGCHRVKDIMFATQEDGSPYIVNWTNQTINLAHSDFPVGYTRTSNTDYVLKYNSGITNDKKVLYREDYEALKNDKDWWAVNPGYSRYNRTSAVNTINTLPDTSPFDGKNTIKFDGSAGANTDGGAINTMTAEEIAVAAAKGWTVSFV